ncbi:MAG TPA: hypothetical protein VK465_12040, partial [Fibrobacteria bacterium]|nr:hypothetical protein [Fibrobacteria bacterium]
GAHEIADFGQIFRFGRVIAMIPGFIEPLRGVKSRTRLYVFAIALFRPLFPLLRRLSSSTTSVAMGRAMIRVATRGYAKPVLDPPDINRLATEG